jgi:DNA-binding transcriptional MerR regulator
MVRHYESLGLLPRVGRTDSGYRQYSEAEVHTLRFIKRSRELGFSMDEIAELVSLWQNRRRASASVKRMAQSTPTNWPSALSHAGDAAHAAPPDPLLPRRRPARLPDPGRSGRFRNEVLGLFAERMADLTGLIDAVAFRKLDQRAGRRPARSRPGTSRSRTSSSLTNSAPYARSSPGCCAVSNARDGSGSGASTSTSSTARLCAPSLPRFRPERLGDLCHRPEAAGQGPIKASVNQRRFS